ncbi:MAG TPA: response regulator transcription factor [Burkholderiaceae bacterium]|jgi:DNA-binding NarL/FixJ family response regulator|nr:response regulator transcription factor [Burkholderiaceae bacterium]
MSQSAISNPIRVLIVEDDAVTRRVLSHAIESSPELMLVAALDSVKPALEWFANGELDVLLTDLGLPDGSGLDVIRACVRHLPKCDIMVITASSDEDNVLACIEAGATGYVLKDAGRLDVVRSVLELRAGGSPISPIIARKVLARMQITKKVADTGAEGDSDGEVEEAVSLTKREAAILDLIARGDSYGDVAKMLSLSVGTIQTHIKNIYEKLSVHSRGEAVFEAHRRGLLQMDGPKSKP